MLVSWGCYEIEMQPEKLGGSAYDFKLSGTNPREPREISANVTFLTFVERRGQDVASRTY